MANNYVTFDGLLFYDAKLRAWVIQNINDKDISITWNDVTGKPMFSTVAVTGNYADLNGTPSIPANVSQLTNDRSYQTATEVSAAIANAKLGMFEKVASLPDAATAKIGTIYLILSSEPSAANIYEEWMVLDGVWEMIGTTAIDLSGYWSKTELTAITNDEINSLFT